MKTIGAHKKTPYPFVLAFAAVQLTGMAFSGAAFAAEAEADDDANPTPETATGPIEEMVVLGRFLSSAEQLMNERKDDAAVTDIMGSDAISRLGDSTVADALRRISGLSLVIDAVDVVRWLMRSFTRDDFVVLKMDVEGAESLVMSSFPWATHRIRVLSVERPKPGLVRELQQHQYGYHCSLGRAAWHDEIWVHRPSMPDVQTSRHPMPSQARPCGQNVSAPVVAVLASHPARARGKGSARATHTAYAGAEEKEKASRVRTDAQRVDALLDF